MSMENYPALSDFKPPLGKLKEVYLLQENIKRKRNTDKSIYKNEKQKQVPQS